MSWHHAQQVLISYAETGGGVAQYRMRVILLDGSMLQCVERVRHVANELFVEKYSFHWQRPDGSLQRRWDNAPHHPEIASFPHHVYDGDELNVLPHGAVDVFGVLELIEPSIPANYNRTHCQICAPRPAIIFLPYYLIKK
jgi:hypothetical protein